MPRWCRPATVFRVTTARTNCFDALRLLAALAVVVGHSANHLDARFLWYDHGNGWWFDDGVVAFFVLSGLMVFRSGERCHERQQPWREFYRNRALRIIPAIYAYTIVIVLALVAVGLINLSNITAPGIIAYILSHLLLVPVYHPPQFADFGVGVINGSLWTIPVEVSFYITVPLIVLLVLRFGFRTGMTALILVAAGGILIRALVQGYAAESLAGKLYSVTFLGWLWFFVLGIFWSRMWKRAPHRGWLALTGFIAYGIVAAIRHATTAPEYKVILTAVAAVPLSYTLVWFGNYGPQILGRLTHRIGDLSFGTYIWHMPIVNFFIYFGVKDWDVPGTLKVAAVIALSLAAAALSWHLVEKPALQRKKYSSAPVIREEIAESQERNDPESSAWSRSDNDLDPPHSPRHARP
jgi:peptidoglycan/LPS O-acetylase OafA/YrhL